MKNSSASVLIHQAVDAAELRSLLVPTDAALCCVMEFDRSAQSALLFAVVQEGPERRKAIELEAGAVLLKSFAFAEAPELLAAIEGVAASSPWRHMTTARGWRMSVAMTNCGEAGWVSDRSGYHYESIDPQTNRRWPEMPALFAVLAGNAAGAAGFDQFLPDVCLINRYEPGNRLSLHQDRDERAFDAPIVSVSLGAAATFLWGGRTRAERPCKVLLEHGDVVVWGGPARMNFHGIDTLRAQAHELTGANRLNLTFRHAL